MLPVVTIFEASMNIVIIANIISLLGCALMVFVGLLKEKRQILSVQCVQFVLQGAANLMLGGKSGFIANVVSILRNLAFFRFKNTVWLKLFFIALQLLLSLGSLGGGIISWFPLFSAVLFTWFLDLKSEVKLKIVIIITQILWLAYDFAYSNYVAVVFDCFTMLSNIIGIVMILRDRKNMQK